MGNGVRTERVNEPSAVLRAEDDMRNETGVLNLIEQHRKTVLWSPFVLALVLGVVYMFAGNEFRQVIDFFAPGHIFGR